MLLVAPQLGGEVALAAGAGVSGRCSAACMAVWSASVFRRRHANSPQRWIEANNSTTDIGLAGTRPFVSASAAGLVPTGCVRER